MHQVISVIKLDAMLYITPLQVIQFFMTYAISRFAVFLKSKSLLTKLFFVYLNIYLLSIKIARKYNMLLTASQYF